MNDVERQAVFVIADISGYTKFIFSNEKEIAHSQIIIRELITTLLGEVNLPLRLIRIEGDAIFLYAIKDDPEYSWDTASKNLVSSLLAFFRVFSNKLAELTIHKICSCTACVNIEQLKLKAVVHSGLAAFYRINEHQELTGTGGKVEPGEETYDDIGAVKTYVYHPPEPEPYVPSADAKPPPIFMEALRSEVSQEYAQVAQSPERGFHFHIGRRLAGMLEFRDKWLEGLPEQAIESFAGTGNALGWGPLQPNDRVVDAGCGAGLDTLIAGRMVGHGGEVIGVDMTREMLDKATHNAEAVGAKNVSFKAGYLEDLPVGDEWADVVISNGAINLAPDKDDVFGELNRVQKPGGRLQIADILVEKPIPDNAKRNIELWTG